jgi:hypothetical protein
MVNLNAVISQRAYVQFAAQNAAQISAQQKSQKPKDYRRIAGLPAARRPAT